MTYKLKKGTSKDRSGEDTRLEEGCLRPDFSRGRAEGTASTRRSDGGEEKMGGGRQGQTVGGQKRLSSGRKGIDAKGRREEGGVDGYVANQNSDREATMEPVGPT